MSQLYTGMYFSPTIYFHQFGISSCTAFVQFVTVFVLATGKKDNVFLTGPLQTELLRWFKFAIKQCY